MKSLKKYLITMLAGLAVAAWIAWSKDILAQSAPAEIFHILCDSFFVVGWLIFAAGMLIFSTNEGAFDMLAYGMKSFMDIFRREKKLKFTTYYDYRMDRAEKKVSFGFLLICGGIYLAISLVMLLLYHQFGG